jgi:hypothetical protein
VLLGTENITDVADPVNDTLVGVLGSVLYGLVYQRLRHGKVWRGWR